MPDARHAVLALAKWRSHTAVVAFWVAFLLVWALTLLRVNAFASDYGTYVSVAQRLMEGDRLYTDVWDNKDPLFFYLLALVRAVSPVGVLVLEVGWFLLASCAVAAIARASGLTSVRVGVAAWILTPLVLGGATYMAGMTHLPGSALSLALLASALHRRWRIAGAGLGTLALLKLPMLPVAVVMVLVVAVSRRQQRELVNAAYAALGALGALGLLMAIRGELGGYVGAQLANVSYSASQLIDVTWGPFVGHLLRVVPEGGRSGLVTLAAILGILILCSAPPFWRGFSSPRGVLWWCTLMGLLTAVGVLGLTATWTHHAQILYLPGVLAMVLLLNHLPDDPVPWYRGREVSLLLLAAYLVGGAVHPLKYVEAADAASAGWGLAVGPSEEARALRATASSGSYARLGTNDLTMHARGLEGWKLACRRFHQYPFDPPSSLNETVACLPKADAVIVDFSFGPLTEPQERPTLKDTWDPFVADAQAVLDAQFTCERTSFGQLCLKRHTK